MSTWETYDRIVKGERIRFGGRAWDDMMLGEIDQAASRLAACGAPRHHDHAAASPERAHDGI